MRNSGKPELRAIHIFAFRAEDVDARDVSTFTRVFRRAMPGHDECGERT
jgi:hypothetical protein